MIAATRHKRKKGGVCREDDSSKNRGGGDTAVSHYLNIFRIGRVIKATRGRAVLDDEVISRVHKQGLDGQWPSRA